MAGNHKRRKRKIDLENLSPEQADKLAKQIGDEIAKIMDEANTKCNEMLRIYGLQTEIGYEIVQIAENTKKKSAKTSAKKPMKKTAKL